VQCTVSGGLNVHALARRYMGEARTSVERLGARLAAKQAANGVTPLCVVVTPRGAHLVTPFEVTGFEARKARAAVPSGPASDTAVTAHPEAAHTAPPPRTHAAR
jgi:hypothetical protein